jgi:SulP family sulfate permease
VLLSVGESLSAARGFAAKHRQVIDPDQELIGLGTANLAAGFLGGFSVDASLSQSAAGEAAGTRSQLSSLVTAGLMLATALVLAPLFHDLPLPVLAAVVTTSVISLVDVSEVRR